MKKIIGKRASGKTTKLIRECEKHGGYIVCESHERAFGIITQAKEMGIHLSFPLEYRECLNHPIPHRLGRIHIDNVEHCLQDLFRVKIKTITLTEDEQDEECWKKVFETQNFKEAHPGLIPEIVKNLVANHRAEIEVLKSQRDEARDLVRRALELASPMVHPEHYHGLRKIYEKADARWEKNESAKDDQKMHDLESLMIEYKNADGLHKPDIRSVILDKFLGDNINQFPPHLYAFFIKLRDDSSERKETE